jgi:hypothetical protein
MLDLVLYPVWDSGIQVGPVIFNNVLRAVNIENTLLIEMLCTFQVLLELNTLIQS